MNDFAFSGGDVGALILTSRILSDVQSGPRLFVYLKSALAPACVDFNAVHDFANDELQSRVGAEQTFQQTSRIIAQGRALRYGLASYRGMNGVARRVEGLRCSARS